MASYVDSVLADGERRIYSAKLTHWKFSLSYVLGITFLISGVAAYGFNFPSPASAAIVGASCVAFGSIVFLYAVIRRASTELVLTNKRLIVKTGLITRDTVEMNLGKVESIRVSQSLLGRMFNYGDIAVVGTGSSLEPIRNIADPLELRRRIGESSGG